MANGRQKGAAFERLVCKMLHDDLGDYNWRRDLEQYRAGGGVMHMRIMGIMLNYWSISMISMTYRGYVLIITYAIHANHNMLCPERLFN
jgi:hypothetical protein